jgi:hypothetical protein
MSIPKITYCHVTGIKYIYGIGGKTLAPEKYAKKKNLSRCHCIHQKSDMV